ncbi:hypothetical protein [Ruegeria sp. Ofav3-42]|uniref:hypothetical protein n=1 Tax=Ruegeria sp. Ofav3-42 TaxID=2917759 RepID=UPI001EF6CF39|nr:hypothetical protein [Ruegeria sp. Ofav3-42]MCG7518839.1 hypothetical protein [Ruegeria sp. Ofav3-42]
MQGQEPNMQVAIHAGAAFTDEGRLLSSLQANGDMLAQYGVALFGPRRYRQVFKPAFEALNARPPMPDEIERIRGNLPTDPEMQRTIFTSDGFAGEKGTLLSDGQLYPSAGKRMSVLEEAFRDCQVELFLALRNPGSFIPKHLMSLTEEERKNAIRSNDLSHLSWIGMIEDIRDFAPDVQITLWANEDTPLIWGDILRSIGGLPDDAQIVDEYDLLISLLTDKGKALAKAILDAGSDQPKADTRDALAAVLDDHAQPEKIEEELDLPGWSEEIVDAFFELYEQDLSKLDSMTGVRVLKP